MEIEAQYIIGAIIVMGLAIGWLGRNQWTSNRECRKESAECRAKQAKLDEFIRTTLMKLVGDGAARESETTAELSRSRHVNERLEKRLPADNDQTPLQPARTHG